MKNILLALCASAVVALAATGPNLGGGSGLSGTYNFSAGQFSTSGSNVSLNAAIAQLATNRAVTNVQLAYSNSPFPSLSKSGGTVTLMFPVALTNWAAIDVGAKVSTNDATMFRPTIVGDLTRVAVTGTSGSTNRFSVNGTTTWEERVDTSSWSLYNEDALAELFSLDNLGDATVAGTVTATAFVGDGSGLTGINGSQTPWSSTINGAGYPLTNAGSITSTGEVTAAGYRGSGSGAGALVLDGANSGRTTITQADSAATNTLTLSLGSPSDGQVLKYDSGSGTWTNKADNNSGGGGSSAFIESNLVISSTANTLLDVGSFDRFTIKLLTNATLTFTNASSLTRRARVLLQQDTNGQRSVTWANAGGLLQTNASLVVTTNANALDLLEVEPSLFSTNLLAWWPQNFQPRVAFTNSLDAGGGGGGGGSPLITSGLVLYYKFDEGSGTTAIDASGNGRNGTLTGGVVPNYTTAYIGANALTGFDNSDGYVDSGVNAAANPGTGDFSIAVWAKTSSSGTVAVCGKDGGSGYALFLSGGVAFFQVEGGNSCTGGSGLGDGNWHHYVCTISGTTSTIYIDGSLVDTGTTDGNISPGSTFRVGNYGDGSFSFDWPGSIDEVGLYSRALSSGEVTTLYNQSHP